MNYSGIYLFRIDENDRVSTDLEQDDFISSTNGLSSLNVKIVGKAGSSLVSVSEVADFFDVSGEWEYEWAFRENEYIMPRVLIALVNGS